MAKKKDSVALYEVISKTRRKRSEAGLGVPSWMGQTTEATEVPPAAKQREQAPAERMIASNDGRLKLSLNYVSLLGIALVVLLLVVAAFWVGRWSASAGESQATPAKPTAQVPQGESTQREPGKHYLIIQGLQGMAADHRAAADQIVSFLRAEGIEADIGTWPDPKQYVVWSQQGFDSQTSDEAVAYVRQIEKLGTRFKAQGGKYEFKQKRDRDGRIKPWFGKVPRPDASP